MKNLKNKKSGKPKLNPEPEGYHSPQKPVKRPVPLPIKRQQVNRPQIRRPQHYG
ncbi:MAG: hypothetical protein PHX72_01300 [Candidatus Shapirobacteria bacterium]|nr:hypothetical protein [Candidatus Shapirobacteria bacterium]